MGVFSSQCVRRSGLICWVTGRLLHVCIKDSPPLAQLGALGRDHYHEREEADRRRREQNIHFQDGRYGVKPPPMYSDALMQKGRGFDS